MSYEDRKRLQEQLVKAVADKDLAEVSRIEGLGMTLLVSLGDINGSRMLGQKCDRSIAQFLEDNAIDYGKTSYAVGVAMTGDREYAEELRGQGADINKIACGAAEGVLCRCGMIKEPAG